MPHLLAIILSLFVLAIPAIATPVDFTTDVLPVLEANCFKCHGPEKQKGKLRLDTLSTDLLNDRPAAETWHDVRDVLNLGEMPPDDEPDLASADRQKITAWITQEIDTLIAKKSATGGHTVLRRLNRSEYQNTMRDLLGIDTGYAKNLPPESLSPDGFQNNGAVQQMSDQLLEHYLTAARAGLKKAIVEGPAPEVFHHEFTKSIKDKNRGANLLDNDQQFVAKIMEYPAGGEILIRVKARAVLAEGRGFPQLRPAIGYRADVQAPRAFIDPVDVTSEEWQTFEFRARIEHFPLPSKTQSKFPGLLVWLDNAYAEGRDKPLKPRKKKKPKKGQTAPPQAPYPNIEIASLKFTGPVFDSWPPPHHTRILPSSTSRNDTTSVLRNFLQRAFRRPVAETEITPFLTYFKTLRSQSQTYTEALRETLAMALVSPGFLYLVEPVRAGDTRLGDWEIASRLSYFLWSTMPDDQLFRLARAGTLHEPETLNAQVARMLKDPRSAQFVANFTDQWLDVDAIDRVAVNPEYYPDFDNAMKHSMRGETHAFFSELLHHDLSALNIIDSKFAMLDGPLAEYYGVTGPRGSTFQRVALPAGSNRGGVLAHASILVGNSTGEDSHPVKRAVWLRDRLLHDPPNDPPPNVPALDSTDPEFARLPVREQLRLHREDSACNDCHRGIDPWGIALENFGGDGLWRDTIPRKKARGRGFDQQPVVTRTTLPDGTAIDGIAQLKTYLLEHRQNQFDKAFTSKLLTYALGRTLELEDEKTLTHLTDQFSQNGHKIAPLIQSIVTHDVFLTK